MEEKNIKHKNLLGGITFGLIIVSVLFLTFGCSGKKSGGGGGAGYNGRYNYGGPGYGGNGNVARVGAGIENNGRYMVIMAASTTSYNNGGYSSGPADIYGEIRVYQPIGCSNMNLGINPGRYQLVPYQQNGYLDLNMMSGGTFLISGSGFQALITVPYSFLFQTNVCGYEGMMGTLNIESVNGQYCGITTGFTDNVTTNMCTR